MLPSATLRIVSEQPPGLLVSTASAKLRQLVAARIAPLGITSQQFWVMLLLGEGALDSVQQIGKLVSVDKAAASRLAEKLAARRWVRTSRSTSDRRRVGIVLTAAGKQTAARFHRLAERINDEVERGLSQKDKRVAQDILQRMIANLDAALAH
jgi:DNA-binding MarR family transcriptional regulator